MKANIYAILKGHVWRQIKFLRELKIMYEGKYLHSTKRPKKLWHALYSHYKNLDYSFYVNLFFEWWFRSHNSMTIIYLKNIYANSEYN